jgi:hypothetical protein
MRPPSAAEESIEAGVLHLEHSVGVLSFARVATTLLHGRLPWVTTLLYPTASDRGECILAMLFWVLAALSVVGALAVVWVLYLLARRSGFSSEPRAGDDPLNTPRPVNGERGAG